MGKLAHLTSGVEQIRKKLENAEMGDIGNVLDDGLAKVNKNLQDSLDKLVKEANQSQNVAFSNAVQQAVLSVTQSQQIILNALSRITAQVIESAEATSKEVDKVNSGVGGVKSSLAGQIDNLAKLVERLPTQIPEPEKVDLSGIDKNIKALGGVIKAIPAPIIPEQKDATPAIKALEKKLAKRVHEFTIHRDDDKLVTKITVKAK